MIAGRSAPAHFHCPNGCEHPQPFQTGQVIDHDGTRDSTWYCGLCALKGLAVPCEICIPGENCDQ
jgi:hypothetical protein